MIRSALLAISRSTTLARHLPRYGFARAAARRFLPGETAEAALEAATRLRAEGMEAALTLLGEALEDPREADEVAEHYHGVLETLAEHGGRAHLSVKPTQLGIHLDLDRTTAHVRDLAEHAARIDGAVWIDMESSAFVDPTLRVFRAVVERHRNVGLCLQAYLHRTSDDLKALLEVTRAIRLVKGAYREPASVAMQDRGEIDAAFLRSAQRLTATAERHPDAPLPALGTHDVELIRPLLDARGAGGDRAETFELQMLYGIRNDELRRLARGGVPARVLINYGPAWFPWFMRRLAERPANLWFVARNAFGG